MRRVLRPAARSNRPATKWRRSSVVGRAVRSCSRAVRPSRSATACSVRPHEVTTKCSLQSSTPPCASLSRNAGESTVVAVDGKGRVAVDDVLDALQPQTACVHVQWGNHEVGTVQPVADVVAVCRSRGVLVHVDAAQAAGHVEFDFATLGCDLLSVSAHKMGGPPGIGALLVRRGVRLRPLLVGGDQERARRAGYENVPAIAGFGATVASIDVSAESAMERALTDRILRDVGEGLVPYGDLDRRLPHLVCFGVPGIEPQAVLLGLDRAGIAAHSAAARARPKRSSRLRPGCDGRGCSSIAAACRWVGRAPTTTSTRCSTRSA